MMYPEPVLEDPIIIYVVICLYTPQPSLLSTVYVTTVGLRRLSTIGYNLAIDVKQT